MRTPIALALLLMPAAPAVGQLSPEQKALDFQELAAVYARQYAPYEWKRTAFGLDIFRIGPWLDRVRATRDDLDFFEVCVEFVASLNDAHDVFRLPSVFSATLGFSTDIYDGRVLIDSISRARLPARDYPFQNGDEVVSVDGVTAGDLVARFEKYSISANERSTRRSAAARITVRSQRVMPHAHEIGDKAIIEIRRQSGELETYNLPWQKTGDPLTVVGPVPSPKLRAARAAEEVHLKQLAGLENELLPEPADVLNYGALSPVFALPSGFVTRLGRFFLDSFYTGTFESGGFKIGYLRIPSFAPASTARAIRDLETEIAFLQANTDGLIVDEMRNPGGNACYNEEVLRRLIHYPFVVNGRRLRATTQWILTFSAAFEAGRRQGAPKTLLDQIEKRLHEVEAAYRENRGLTGPISVCALTPGFDRLPAAVVYSKPLIVLVDEFSASAADSFAAMMQDNKRGPLVGMRTMSAGGNVSTTYTGFYSEGLTSVTQSLNLRRQPVVTNEYPAAALIENIGVRPDIEVDYMTKENLLEGGRPFLEKAIAAVVEHIKAGR